MDFVLDVVGYGTAKALVPLLSFGWIKVDRPIETSGGFNWFGFRRQTDSTILLESCAAARLGTLFWLLVLVAVLALLR